MLFGPPENVQTMWLAQHFKYLSEKVHGQHLIQREYNSCKYQVRPTLILHAKQQTYLWQCMSVDRRIWSCCLTAFWLEMCHIADVTAQILLCRLSHLLMQVCTAVK